MPAAGRASRDRGGETHDATTEDGVSLAYQVMGDRPIDLVVDFAV